MPKYISNEAAARMLANADRILVIGCSGGGKTTLSRKISDSYDLEYQSLDRDVRWLPGWHVRDRQEQRDLITGLAQTDRWIMDGSGASTFDLRLPRTDLVIWVRVPRSMALLGLARRILLNYGTVRFGMAEGCPEGLPDREFLSYIWNFERKHVPYLVKNIDQYGPNVPVVVLRSHRQMDQLIHQ